MLSFSSDMSTFVEYIGESYKLRLATALHDASSKVTSSSPIKRLRCKVSAFQMEELLGVKLKLPDEGEWMQPPHLRVACLPIALIELKDSTAFITRVSILFHNLSHVFIAAKAHHLIAELVIK